MAAATDKFKYLARKWVGQIGAGGVADDTTTTIPLASTTNLPSATGVTVVIDRVDANGTKTPSLEETVTGVVSGSNLISCTRGVEGTAQAHDAGAVVEVLLTAADWQSVMDGILVDHDQSGQHGSLTDANGNEWISQTATASAVNEFTVANAVTGSAPVISATGDDTNIGIKLTPKGTGEVEITANDLNLSGTTPNVQVGGADPLRTIVLPAASWKETTTGGCAAVATVEAGTNDIDYQVLDFDASSDEKAFINFTMPDSYDGGTITAKFVWTAASSSGDVVWGLQGRAYANDDAIDQALGTAQTVTDTLTATGDICITAATSAITLAGSPAGGQMVHLRVYRDADAGGDTLAADARLIAVHIEYSQSQYSD